MQSRKPLLFSGGIVAALLFAGCDSNPATAEADAVEAAASQYPQACGNCEHLCRLDAFDRASGKPDSLVSCALLRSQLGMVVLRSQATPQLWLVTPEVLIRADYPIFDSDGLDLRPEVIRDTRRRWPWLWDGVGRAQPQAAVPPAVAPPPARAPVADPPVPAAGPATRWFATATAGARQGPLAGIEGDFRDFSQEDFTIIMDWIETAWPGPEGWRHMAWVDPQCSHCKRLIETGDTIEHYAPRIIMDPRANEARAAAGWLLADPPELDRFLAFEPADPVLSESAAQNQRLLDELLYGLRPDWGFVVPVQMIRGDGWLVWWPGSSEPPEPFAALLATSAELKPYDPPPPAGSGT